jgi:SAM-dependent methyltransferase
MQTILHYKFEKVETCEMCGNETAGHKVIGQRLNQSQGLRPREKEGIAVTVKKCTACGLLYPSYLPIPDDIGDHYGVPPEEYWKPSYFQPEPNYFAREIGLLKRLLPYEAGQKTLDIGAGIGKGMVALQNAGYESYGFEPSVPFRDRAISKMGISEERLKLGMIEQVEYDNASFDFITYGAVFEHLYHPAVSLEKAMRWLKPNGFIHIEVPSADHLIPKLINKYYRLRGTNYVTNISPMHDPFHLYEFTLKSFQDLARRMNFEIVHHQYIVGCIYHVPSFLHPPLRKYMARTNTGMQLIVWLRPK